jgi:hypothetical protein
MNRARWLVLLVVMLGIGAYVVYDWNRPCIGGPVKQFVKSVANGGSYTVRCAG